MRLQHVGLFVIGFFSAVGLIVTLGIVPLGHLYSPAVGVRTPTSSSAPSTTQATMVSNINAIHYNIEATSNSWLTPYRNGMELAYGSPTTVAIGAGSIRLNSKIYTFTGSGILTPIQTMGQAYAVCAEEAASALQINLYKLTEDMPAADIYNWDEAGYFLPYHNTTGRCRPTDSNGISILLGYFAIGKTYAASGTGTEVLRYSIVNTDTLNGTLLPDGVPHINMVFVPGQTLAIDLYEAQVCTKSAPLTTNNRCLDSDWGGVDGKSHSGYVVSARSKYNVYPGRGNGNWANGLTYHDFLRAGETVGKRLPGDVEWSLAAQYGLTRLLPTGTTANMPKGNNGVDYDGTDPEETGGTTANRDIYTMLGLADTNGNLWEYVSDGLQSGTEDAQPEQFGGDFQFGGVVIRGGNWGYEGNSGIFARYASGRAVYGSLAVGARFAR